MPLLFETIVVRQQQAHLELCPLVALREAVHYVYIIHTHLPSLQYASSLLNSRLVSRFV